jgi:acyl-CoA thioesterase I
MSRPVTTLIRLLPTLALASVLGCARADPAADDSVPVAAQPPARAAIRDTATAQNQVKALPRIVFLGDSLTAGLGISKDEAVPALIQERLQQEGYAYEVINAGNSGDTSEGGLARLNWSLAGDVKVMVVELGANDGLRGTPPERTRQNLETIVKRAKDRGIAVLLTGMEAPPNYGAAYTSRFRDTFREVAEHEGVAFMPFFLDGVAGIRELNQPDGIHPTPEGARIVAGNVWRYLEPLLKKTQS